MTQPMLFTPIKLRDLTLKNRIVVSPMCQYSAKDGFVTDWHFVHLGKFAQGGAGAVFVEASAVEPHGRITYGDVGIWSDAHTAPLKRIASFIKSQGAAPAMQLAHAGRKASMQRPWHGNGPLDASDLKRGETPWPIVAPSAIPMDEGWLTPSALSTDDLAKLREAWRLAVLRSLDAGFEILEIHSAHGYLLHEFLSPLTNKRNDAYGGDRSGRMRFPLEVAETVRSVWPQEKPLFLRISSVDGLDGGWSLDDSVAYARELAARGVDVIDCSSGGLIGSATAAKIPRGLGFQVPFAERIRKEAGIKTMTVGLIVEPRQAEAVLQGGQADLIAIGREALFNPNWPLHAQYALAGSAGDVFADWPQQYGWWLTRREPGLRAAREAAAKKA
jgi:2,4-dienoyl-CoA reductase-like NADH-dependent reductase (Old Yellow Enzyme family)